MGEDFPTANRTDEESLFILEDEAPFSALGRDKLWLSIEDEISELTLDAGELFKILLLQGEELPDHCLALEGGKVSRLVLTFSGYESAPFGASYDIGFFEGEMFRALNGYRIYPDPTHRVPLPKPPRASS
jgi:hypothetical protein